MHSIHSKGWNESQSSSKSIAKMKSKIKEITARSNGMGNELLKTEIESNIITGWINYFKIADMKNAT